MLHGRKRLLPLSLHHNETMFFLLIHLLLLTHATEADPGGGCFFFQEERAVRCTNSSTAEVAASLRTLLDAPLSVEAVDCRLHGASEEAPPPLDLPASVLSLRISRCATPLSVIRSASLTEMDLSENGLEEVPRLSHLVTLKRLLLRGNRLSRLHATHLPASLVELDLTGNRLGVMADHGRNGYTLKGSLPLSDFRVPSPEALSSLSLSGNRLASLPEQLSEFRNLRTLDLSRNELRGEVTMAPAVVESLESLDLRSNRITLLSPFHAPKLRRLDLTENPLHCDCGSTWMMRLSNVTTLLLPLCQTPEHRRGNTLAAIADDCNQGAVAEERHEVERLTALSASTVEVQWRGSREAVLVYRQEGADHPPRKMTIVPPSSAFQPITRTQTIQRLLPSASYIFCVARAATPTTYTVDPSKCKGVLTPPRPAPLLSDVSTSDTSVRLRWRLDDDGNDVTREWRIRVRRGGANSAHYHYVTSDGWLYEYSVTDLTPRTDYDVCVMMVGGGSDEACVTVRTEGEEGEGLHAAVGVAIFLCVLIVVVAAIVLYRRRGHTPPPIEEAEVVEEEEVPMPRKEDEGGVRNYARSWNTLRLPSHDHPPPPLFRSFRSPCGYRDHLTSVTIYSSGHSEC